MTSESRQRDFRGGPAYAAQRATDGRREVSTLRRPAFLLSMLLGFGAFVPVVAWADVLSDVNTVRIKTCAGEKPRAALQLSSKLSSAAQSVARGATPHDALVAVGYAASRIASIHVQGYGDDARLRQVLAQAYCSLIVDPEFKDIGIGWTRDNLWLILAVERSVPGDADVVSGRVLSLVNDARSRPRRCGSQTFAAGKPLRLNAQLGRAALLHSQEMAKYSFMAHQGRDGSSPAQRATRAGYQWTAVGENVAAGPGTAEEVMAGWLANSGHCANIMSARYSEMGVAFVVNTRDDFGVYWTLSLAAPR
jgi:uncharacterized protein YkwD